MSNKEPVTMRIDDDLLEWIDSISEFGSRSHGIRRCVEITKKLYEESSPEEFVKFTSSKRLKD